MKTLFMFALWFALGVGSFAQSRPSRRKPPISDDKAAWQKLLTYEGRNLRKLNQREGIQLYKILPTLLPAEDPHRSGEFFSHYFFTKIQPSPTVARYVLVEGQPLIIIPGESKGRVHIFNGDGRFLADEKFQTGWRITIDGARLVRNSAIGVPVIEFLTGAAINGRDVARQFYGLLNDRVVLIRLEDSDGKVVRNMYTPANFLIGPLPPDRTVEEWEKALMSDNAVEVLRTLMWIAGTDGDQIVPLNNAPRPYIRGSSYADVWIQLRRRESVIERLNQLKGSKNRWIREAAELATGVNGDK